MFLLINKPIGLTSHDVIQRLRRLSQIKKIGHAGTLDPFASGLLVVALGRASTKNLRRLSALDKTYLATLRLGAVSDTLDPTGQITLTNTPLPSDRLLISQTLQKFIGRTSQLPPRHSAKKINGQRAYRLARQNKTFLLQPQLITIHELKLVRLSQRQKTMAIKLRCSAGTYVRSLAGDIGQRLGCGAYLTSLVRTSIGPFYLKNAWPLQKITARNWQRLYLPALPTLPSQKKVIVFGTFDLLHPGHLNFLRQAQKLGDQLFVIIARDTNVKKIKNRYPQESELVRLKNIKKLNLAKDVMLGSASWASRFSLLNKIKPDIIALGYDQPINLAELNKKLKKYRLNSRIIRLKAYQPHQFKSSKYQ